MSTMPQLVSRVDFVTIPTRDLGAAVEFYGTKIGLPCSTYRADRHFAEFETGNLTLGVITRRRREWSTMRTPTRSPCTSRTSRPHGRRWRAAA